MKAIRRSAALLLLMFFSTVVKAEEGTTPAVKTVTPPADVKALMATRCQPCHFELRVQPSLLLNTGKWFRLTSDNFEIERRVFLEAPPHSMPMGALLNESERKLLQDWFNQLHTEL